MNEYQLGVIQRIMDNRSEYWALDESIGWVVIVESEPCNWGNGVSAYIVDSKTRFELGVDDAADLFIKNGWRNVLQESDHEKFFSLWMEWRNFRKPIEEQHRIDLAEAQSVLTKLYELIPRFDFLSLHQLQVQVAGRRYLGVRAPEETEQNRPHRRAHCWNCRRGLDNFRDYECRSCNWILCRCGACNCGCNANHQCPRCGVTFRVIDCRGSHPFCSPECRFSTLQEYSDYLRSSTWRMRRELRLEYDKNICQDCGEPASEVHHLTYERIGSEERDDLISLCKVCHAIRHGDVKFTKNPHQFIRKLSGIKN
jgi:hypothetical protein